MGTFSLRRGKVEASGLKKPGLKSFSESESRSNAYLKLINDSAV